MAAPHLTFDAATYGGGVQSTAELVLAVKGYIDCPVFLFANTGDDSEHPATLRYVREIAFDYAWSNGIELHEIDPPNGQSLRQRIMEVVPGEGLRQPIPFRAANGKPLARSCTADWKVARTGAWLQARGFSETNPADVAVGISKDEWQRANEAAARPWERLHYPLLRIEWKGAVGLTRDQCKAVIAEAALPIPPKSSCYFCPFTSPARWSLMRRNEPELFQQAVELEDHANVCAAARGTRPVYLTRFGRPLSEAIAAAQDGLFGDDWSEDEGYRCGDVCDT